MSELADLARWTRLIEAMNRIADARSIEAITNIVRDTARSIIGADGITFVRREEDLVRYVAEDAVGPLWVGQSFPIEACISGIAIVTRETIVIPDIRRDPRVPLNAYLSTFVKSMAMVPVGLGEPVAAIGAYWQRVDAVEPEAVDLLNALARSAGSVLAMIDAIAAARETQIRLAAGGNG